MNNRAVMLSVALLVLIALSNFGYAIQVSDLEGGVNSNAEEIAKINAEVNSKIANLEVKLSELATKQDVIDLLTVHLTKTSELNDYFRSMLIVTFIIIGLAFTGLGYSIYFYFKGKGRT